MSEAPAKAGWYPAPDMHQTLRFWDGDEWTDDMAPAPPQATGPDAVTRVVIIAVGLVVGWLLIWLGAQAAPDTFYFPIRCRSATNTSTHDVIDSARRRA